MVIRAAGSSTFPQADATPPAEQRDSSWEPFSRTRLDALVAAGTPVFIDFTARWCLICQANHLVLESAAVSETFDAYGVVRMKADWTKYNSTITEELKRHDRSGSSFIPALQRQRWRRADHLSASIDPPDRH